MASFGGLIGNVLGSAGKGLVALGEQGMKKQAELDLRKQLMDIESEKRLREDEIKRSRDISDIGARTKATAQAGLEAAPIQAQTEVASQSAKIDAANKVDLPTKQAEYKKKEFTSEKQLNREKAEEATSAKITETKTLAEDKDYIKAVEALDVAGSAGKIESAKQSARLRVEGGGGGKTPTVRKVITGDNGNTAAVMSDGTIVDLGVKSESFNKNLAAIITKMSADDAKFAKLPEDQKRAKALERLTGEPSQSKPSGKGKAGIEQFDSNR